VSLKKSKERVSGFVAFGSNSFELCNLFGGDLRVFVVCIKIIRQGSGNTLGIQVLNILSAVTRVSGDFGSPEKS
jgi:hypothetical protein